MCWLRSPIALGGLAGAFGCAGRAGFFAAFFETGLRAGALFFEADFFEAFFRAGIRCTSFIRGVRCLADPSMTQGELAGKGVRSTRARPET